MSTTYASLKDDIDSFLSSPNAMRSLVILVISVIVAYLLSKLVAIFTIYLARKVAVRSDSASTHEKTIKLRRVETYLSIGIAILRTVIIVVVGFYTWQLLSPSANLSLATIGAGTFFVVIAGATLGMILRDITAGAAMIAEHWFHVGDFVTFEPFLNVSGVVERITLRSTKLRNLSGEVVWVHNQHIQSAKITPNGLRTIAIDIFVNNEIAARTLIEKVIAAMPVGTIKVAEKPSIKRVEQWSDYLWLFTVVGQTPPGREWLMENYFVDSLKELDEKRRGKNIIARPPLVRFADPIAEKSFKRAVRIKKQA